MSAKNFFNKGQQDIIVKAIADAEKNTSGEVRVHLDSKCKGAVLDVAADTFFRLKMDKTVLRNGVLFYLSVEDHQFAILGDKGINEKVPADFWDSIKDTVISNFKQGKYTEGLAKGIDMTGEKLKAHFPYRSDDTNELNDELSFSDK